MVRRFLSAIKQFIAWVLSNLAWIAFSAGASLSVTALVGYAVTLPGAWYVAFLIGLFVAGTALASLLARMLWAFAQQHGPLAKSIEERRALRNAYSSIETELLSIQIQVDRTLETGSWWLPSMTLPATAWQEHSSLLSKGESREVFRVCRDAFVLGDVANKLVHSYHSNPPTPEHLNEIRGLRNATAKALDLLRDRLGAT
jgi:hypothetical protein